MEVFFLIHEYNFKEFFFVLLLSYYANLPLLYPHFKKIKNISCNDNSKTKNQKKPTKN